MGLQMITPFQDLWVIPNPNPASNPWQFVTPRLKWVSEGWHEEVGTWVCPHLPGLSGIWVLLFLEQDWTVPTKKECARRQW